MRLAQSTRKTLHRSLTMRMLVATIQPPLSLVEPAVTADLCLRDRETVERMLTTMATRAQEPARATGQQRWQRRQASRRNDPNRRLRAIETIQIAVEPDRRQLHRLGSLACQQPDRSPQTPAALVQASWAAVVVAAGATMVSVASFVCVMALWAALAEGGPMRRTASERASGGEEGREEAEERRAPDGAERCAMHTRRAKAEQERDSSTAAAE